MSVSDNSMRRSYIRLAKTVEEYMGNATKLGYKKLTGADFQTMPGVLANWPTEFIKSISYQFYDVIVSCTYKGTEESCQRSNFKLFEHSELFNCYTFQNKDVEDLTPGPENGLTMILYIGNSSHSIFLIE